jgi:thymidylate synthase (FAD)
MKQVSPQVYVIARTVPDYTAMGDYLDDAGGLEWLDRIRSSGQPAPLNGAQDLTEFAGRLCYRSWAPGLNKNVRKVRTDQAAYLGNILESRHGSVLEHVSYTFVLANVSRICTHEIVRHRPGTAVSQESLRFVRLDEIPFWFPDWAQADPELMARSAALLDHMEEFQRWAAGHFGLDAEGVKFSEKKAKTSFMRRLAPDGVATALAWTANLRTLRHVIEERTAEHAEEEIRLVLGMVAEIMTAELPEVFGDFTRNEAGAWVSEHRKV